MKFNSVIMEHGATRVVDAWGDDVPDGKITDYNRAVKAMEGEKVVYSWIEWPSKEARDAGWEKIIAAPRMYSSTEPYDNKRRVYGGFKPILVDLPGAPRPPNRARRRSRHVKKPGYLQKLNSRDTLWSGTHPFGRAKDTLSL